MAIKTEVTALSERPKKSPYPTLRRSRTGGTVVLFTGPTEGVALDDPDDTHGVGRYSDEWTHANDTVVWERIASVTITEED